MMTMINSCDVEKIIRDVSAEKIMPRYRCLKKDDVAFKSGDDPVTIADKEAEIELSKRLKALLPGSNVVGEEAYAVTTSILSSFQDDAPVWILDPVDGTKNFVAENDNFGVIVALAIKGEVVAGWLYHPVTDEFITSEKGAGAYHQGKRLKSLPGAPLDKMTGTTYHDAFYAKGRVFTQPAPTLVKPIMSCCLEVPSLTVAGKHFGRDAQQLHFWLPETYCKPWDYSATLLIHREAGGYARHWNGKDFSLRAYPAMLGVEVLCAPDADSWHHIHAWLAQNGHN